MAVVLAVKLIPDVVWQVLWQLAVGLRPSVAWHVSAGVAWSVVLGLSVPVLDDLASEFAPNL